ncbi:MAG: S9 family peptidase [Gammaproteobacteria bacterium]|nr:S9 family peptidase [Gammaproteobacteria bacterium]
MKTHRLLVVAAVLLGAGAAAAAPSVEDFVRLPAFTEVKISPDGRRMAVGVYRDDTRGVAVLDLGTLKVTATSSFGRGNAIADFWWAGSRRLVLASAEDDGPLLAPLPTGELWALDADGGLPVYLVGWRGATQTGTLIQQHSRYKGFATLVAPLPQDPQHVLIAGSPYREVPTADGTELDYDVNAVSELLRLNTYNGSRNGVASAPIPGPVTFLTDDAGQPRYASGVDNQVQRVSFRYRDGRWVPLDLPNGKSTGVLPLALDRRANAVDLSVPEQGGRRCLEQQSLIDGKVQTLACDPQADLDRVLMDFSGASPLAALFLPGGVRIQMLQNDDPDRLLYAAIAQRFPDELAVPVSHSSDGRRVIFKVESDRDPGRWFLYDRDRNSLRLLIEARPWLHPEAMPTRRPIEFSTNDKATIHGFLTLPVDAGKKPPLVVMPHGGPFWIQDTWFWNDDAALLATHGYAVLQVNFRGSGGYGEDFIDAGRYGWGTVMIDDIVAGTRWAVAQGGADPDRICIYGASYGGYAALMSVIRYPKLFRCAVGYAGVYDLRTLLTESDIRQWQQGPTYVHDDVGKDAAALYEQSPIAHVGQIHVPLLLVHGEEDQRAPFAQAKAMATALRQAGVPVIWDAVPQEAHGFYGLEHRVAFYDGLLSFLHQNLAPVSTPASAAR